MTMRTKHTRHRSTSSLMITSLLSRDVHRKALQAALLVKVTSKMTRKMKEWEWVWVTDKAPGTMWRTSRAAWTSSLKISPKTSLSSVRRTSLTSNH